MDETSTTIVTGGERVVEARVGIITYFTDTYMGGYIKAQSGESYQFNMTNVRDFATQLFFTQNTVEQIVGARVTFQPDKYLKADGELKDIARNVRLAPAAAPVAQPDAEEATTAKPAADTAAQAGPTVPLDVQKLVASIVLGPSKLGGTVLFSEIGLGLKALNVSYKDYGFKKLKAFLEACGDAFEIDPTGTTQHVLVVRPAGIHTAGTQDAQGNTSASQTAATANGIALQTGAPQVDEPQTNVPATPAEKTPSSASDPLPAQTTASAAEQHTAANGIASAQIAAGTPATAQAAAGTATPAQQPAAISAPTPKLQLSAQQQIVHMKSQGIRFELFDEPKANRYLTQDNNYFRIRPLRSGFKKTEAGPHTGAFKDLDFAMLVDLAEIDDLFRNVMLKLTLDVEHGARLVLLEEALDHETNPYDLAREFLASTRGEKTQEKLDAKARKLANNTLSDPYVRGLVQRYSGDANGYPLWALLELIDFGSLCWLYSFAANKYGNDQMKQEFYVLTVVRLLRNACAHGNCIISGTFGAEHPETRQNFEVRRFVESVAQIGANQRRRMLNSERAYPIIATLYAHRQLATEAAFDGARESLSRLIERMKANAPYYRDNNYALVHAFAFFQKLATASHNL